MSAGRRLLAVADALPVTVLAVIAGAGSFTHIRDTAAQHGQTGPMSWAVGVSIDLTCVIAARERQRDQRLGITTRRLSWPAIVLAGSVGLSLAANLAQAQPTAWGRIVAAVPSVAFLVAVSMIERRAARRARPAAAQDGRPGELPAPGRPSPVQDEEDGEDGEDEALLAAARRAAAEHQDEHGQPITRDALRARLGVSNQAASDLLRQLRTDQDRPPGAARAARPPSPPGDRRCAVPWRRLRRPRGGGQVPAPAWVADRLAGVSEGDPVHVRRRVTTIDGAVNQSADSYFAIATGERNPDLLTGRGTGGHIARINTVSPSPTSRRRSPPGCPPVPRRRGWTIPEGALDVARFIIRADMAAFDYRFPVPD